MAEGWAKTLKSDVIEAFSAGICPIGVSDRAASAMAEAGVDISQQSSKHIDELSEIDFDYVITLCDNARQQCPVFGGKAEVVHKPFDDPYFAGGGEEEVMAVFRRVRDEIKAFVEKLPEILTDNK